MARDLADLWHYYAEAGAGDDAPTYRAIAHMVADDPQLLDVVQASPPETHHPNHLLAAARFLMLGGLEHPLAAAYSSGDQGEAVVRFRDFVLEHRDAIHDVLKTWRVQTNEVGRVAVIAPALAHVRRGVDRPLGLVEVGTSAGLNLLVDRCHVNYGSFEAGHRASPLQLECRLSGEPPAFTMGGLDIAWRIGLDRSPIDPDDEAASRWLLSCVWVDQADRIDRLATALAMARADPAELVRGDAVEDVGAVLARVPDETHATVLTSWVAFYLSKEQRRDFEQVLAGAGRNVTWISLEHPRVVRDIPVPAAVPDQQIEPSVIASVTFGDDGGHREFLGWAHPHGRWLDWHS